jgi:hypothetical protein
VSTVGRRAEQAVMAVARLVGPQRTEVQILHAGTDDAAVSVRIGKVLLYLHQESTAEHFQRVWEEAKDAIDALPASADQRLTRALRGMPEPAIAANAVGMPACAVTTGKTKGDPPKPYIRVQLGRIAYEVRDRDAFNTCANSFAYARKQAALAFVQPGKNLIVHGAFEAAASRSTRPATSTTSARRRSRAAPTTTERLSSASRAARSPGTAC